MGQINPHLLMVSDAAQRIVQYRLSPSRSIFVIAQRQVRSQVRAVVCHVHVAPAAADQAGALVLQPAGRGACEAQDECKDLIVQGFDAAGCSRGCSTVCGCCRSHR